MKHKLLVIMALLTASTGAWAQDPAYIDLTSDDGKTWTLSSMPAYDAEVEVLYYTDEEVTQMFTDGVNLVYDAGSDSWKLASMPNFDVELEVTYYSNVEEFIEAVNALPAASDVTASDKDAINAARARYKVLTDDEKNETGVAEALATLVEVEKALCFKVDVPAGGYVTYIADQPLCAYSETSPVAVLYTISNVNGTTVTLSNAIDTASVNTPLLIYNTSSAAATLYLMPCNGPASYPTPYAGFKGTIESKAQGAAGNGPWNFANDTKYYGFDGQDFVRIMAAGPVAANRCWIEMSVSNSGARQLTIVRGETTGVAGVQNVNAVSDENWYDLQGRKVQGKPTRKGVYIQNGQKKVIK